VRKFFTACLRGREQVVLGAAAIIRPLLGGYAFHEPGRRQLYTWVVSTNRASCSVVKEFGATEERQIDRGDRVEPKGERLLRVVDQTAPDRSIDLRIEPELGIISKRFWALLFD
jgi:hypothetical protein